MQAWFCSPVGQSAAERNLKPSISLQLSLANTMHFTSLPQGGKVGPEILMTVSIKDFWDDVEP